MATVTPNYSWPVPTSTDLVKDGATAIEALGDAIDATVFALPSGGLTLINTTSFSGVASQSVNDVFSATYTNYVLFINTTMDSGNVGMNLRYRVAGSDNSTSNYNNQTNEINNTALNAERLTGQTIHSLNFRSGTPHNGVVHIFNPFATAKTFALVNLATVQGDTPFNNFAMLNFGATTSFTGYTLIPVSGNFTGSVSTYGVAK